MHSGKWGVNLLAAPETEETTLASVRRNAKVTFIPTFSFRNTTTTTLLQLEVVHRS